MSELKCFYFVLVSFSGGTGVEGDSTEGGGGLKLKGIGGGREEEAGNKRVGVRIPKVEKTRRTELSKMCKIFCKINNTK